MMSFILTLFFHFNFAHSGQKEIIKSILCEKDAQARVIVIQKEGSRFVTLFYKQSEAIISGRYPQMEEAEKSFEAIRVSLTGLDWKCREITANYLYND